MYDQTESDEERRRNRINMASASQKLKKAQKKQIRKKLFKAALKAFFHQINVMAIIIAIGVIIIFVLCTSAWYIIQNDEKNDKIEKLKSIIPLIGMVDSEEITNI